MQRLQCRDLLDLYELLVVNGVDAEAVWPLFEYIASPPEFDGVLRSVRRELRFALR